MMESMVNRRRPHCLAEIEGNEDLIGSLTRGVAAGSRKPLILSGASGTGKTSIAFALAAEHLCRVPGGLPDIDPERFKAMVGGSNPAFHLFDCQRESGKDDIEYLLDQETGREPVGASHHVIVMEEADGLKRAAQSALLVALQSTTAHRQFIFTCIDPEALIVPLRDRCAVYTLEVPDFQQSLAFLGKVAAEEKITIDRPALELLAAGCSGYRNLQEILETVAGLAVGKCINAELVRRTVLRDRSTIILDYLEAIAEGRIDHQRELLAECRLSAPEFVRSIRDVLVHLQLRRIRHRG